MDLSALIFVALAGAWVVYLVPKALAAHEEEDETRSVDSFSDRMRVLARREASSEGESELVVTARAQDDGSAPVEEDSEVDEPSTQRAPSAESTEAPSPEQRRRRRAAAARAAKRRRRVLGLLLLATIGTSLVAAVGSIAWYFIAIPAGLLVAWLVTCRLTVRQERAARVRTSGRTLADEAIADEAGAEGGPFTEDIPVVRVERIEGDSRGWDPVPITLPTYVEKAPAGRTVRTIDLDSTGVWSSGRNEADSQLAREAEQAQQDERSERSAEQRRAAGS